MGARCGAMGTPGSSRVRRTEGALALSASAEAREGTGCPDVPGAPTSGRALTGTAAAIIPAHTSAAAKTTFNNLLFIGTPPLPCSTVLQPVCPQPRCLPLQVH